MAADPGEWDAGPLAAQVLDQVTQAIVGAQNAAFAAGRNATDGELARAALACPALRMANEQIAGEVMAEYAPDVAALVAAETGRIRAAVAGEIAAAIEASLTADDAHAPGGEPCPGCTRFHQLEADAALARRIGGVS